MDPFEPDRPMVRGRRGQRLGEADLQATLVALTGGSALDWGGLRFLSLDDVDQFLKLWLLDVHQHAWARERLAYVYNQAFVYVEDQLKYDLPNEVRRLRDPREAFLRASERGPGARFPRDYCRVLKLMHVVNHLEMQELRAETAVSEIALMELAERVIGAAAERMRTDGLPIQAFYGVRKARPSVITKLLSQVESTAAAVHDKLRYKIVTGTRDDIIPALAWLFKNLVPFPAIIPGQGHNSLLEMADLARVVDALPSYDGPPAPKLIATPNPFSDQSYSAMTFVVNLPVRVYDIPEVEPPKHRFMLGEAVMVTVELHIVDADTNRLNETGESRHDLYKERQMDKVRERLGRSGTKRTSPG